MAMLFIWNIKTQKKAIANQFFGDVLLGNIIFSLIFAVLWLTDVISYIFKIKPDSEAVTTGCY